MPFDINDPETKAAVTKLTTDAVAAAVGDLTGLKDKNAELIKERKEALDKLKAFDGLDVTSIKSLQKHLESSEEAQLIAAGKVDEVINKRFEKMRLESDSKITTLSESAKKATEERDLFKNKYQSSKVETALRAAAEKAKVVPEAIDDVILRGAGSFSVDDDGTIVRRDSAGKIMKTEDGKAYTPELFVEELKPKAPHYWRSSKGGGFGGDDGGGGAEDSISKKMIAAADANDMVEYRRLRKIQAENRKNKE